MDILIAKAFYQMELKDAQVKPAIPIYVFANQPITVKGSSFLLMMLGDGEHNTTNWWIF
ncbi:hypothetical protein J1N35_028859 [Gossypium stocksii]|uniref:Uncharacterized protein n=1 Tax=Gossypium stocksii TaxID=47602 RepID=A0A9D3UWT0_9ROSI|nr:hypothetical protein J1N35_028859 [Gossypium stocksii]